MGNPTASRRGERGFTLIEVMIAATVLMVGILSTFRLIDGANVTTSLNGARLGAQSLEREIVEYGRASDYDSLQPSTLVNVLRQRPSLAGTGPSPWVIRRRGVNYTVTASVCTFDDPKDGLASTPPDNACAAAASLNTLVDSNPDDFRRVTIKLDWSVRAHTGTMTQSALIVNPTGALGPRIIRFDDSDLANADITSGNQLSWSPSGRQLTSSSAAGVHWSADDRVSGGDATGGPTSWSFTWDLGNDASHLNPLNIDNTWVPDGNYTLQAQAVDGRGVPGEARTIVVHINRHAPGPVSNLTGGYNANFGGVVDLQWTRYPERDVRGYVVYRDQVDSDHLVCPSNGDAYIPSTTTSCADTNPGTAGSTHTYYVKAVDCQTLAAASCTPRYTGIAATRQVTLSAGSSLLPPLLITASIADGLPKLDWNAVPGASFYRIYRDTGTGLSDRYDRTITSSPTYTDPNPGDTTRHTYWVTAVDSNFNESSPSAPVTSPGP
ncbi:MAG TPA: prepilin-type N-terminal cleavage/methylation domain-containing protein [Actinopolymorphaceae bacterium]|nr:prepilin-type N-terminal cleavage/methylation domain-containing protein [Actinopolymorphaceae bacterium]